MVDFLHHLFVPRESNNHRARLFHIQPLLLLITILFIGNLLTPHIQEKYPQVLGITANVSIDELVTLTNQKRAEAGLSPLTLNSQLSQAASLKAQDMLAKNYWAHNAPDGTTPWYFIRSAGYEYTYAGENLARGFSTANEALNAWMASPGHRDNILSPHYKDIGFAVQVGTLTGDETVLIVEEFGSQSGGTAAVGSGDVKNAITIPTTAPSPLPTVIAQVIPSVIPTSIPTIAPTSIVLPTVSIEPIPSALVASVTNKPLIDITSSYRFIAMAITMIFLLILVIDVIVIKRKQIIRIASHNVDHILYLLFILLTLMLFGSGVVL
jgi:hypothetical protein